MEERVNLRVTLNIGISEYITEEIIDVVLDTIADLEKTYSVILEEAFKKECWTGSLITGSYTGPNKQNL